MVTLEVWEFVVLAVAPLLTYAAGRLQAHWQHIQSIRALQKSVEDRDAMIRRQATRAW